MAEEGVGNQRQCEPSITHLQPPATGEISGRGRFSDHTCRAALERLAREDRTIGLQSAQRDKHLTRRHTP